MAEHCAEVKFGRRLDNDLMLRSCWQSNVQRGARSRRCLLHTQDVLAVKIFWLSPPLRNM
jgi:hypothetical protein